MTTPAQRVEAALSELVECGDLELPYFFLGGSSGLALRDMRHVGDIDVGTTTHHWHALNDRRLAGDRRWDLYTTHPDDARRRCDPPYLIREVRGIPVHVFHGWRWRGKDESRFNDFNHAFAEGIEMVRGWPCVRLEILLNMKADAVQIEPIRAKDLSDIALIAGLLHRERATA